MDKLIAGVEAFKRQTTDAFHNMQAMAMSATGQMGESFMILAQDANISFSETSFGIQESFSMAFGSMSESAASLWISMGEGAAGKQQRAHANAGLDRLQQRGAHRRCGERPEEVPEDS